MLAAVEEMVNKLLDKYSRIDILVNIGLIEIVNFYFELDVFHISFLAFVTSYALILLLNSLFFNKKSP